MHINVEFLIAAGVGVHLLAGLAKALWRSPKRQAQVDAIERKVDAVLATLEAAKV